MADNQFAYIPTFTGFHNLPLGRFIPALPKGVIGEWLEDNTQPGDLVLDPLGANPMAAIEAACLSRRVLFARNNPAIWLILEMLASAPPETLIRSTVSKLLLSRHGNTTLDNYLQSIYATRCMDCGNVLQPRGYVWEQNTAAPIAKVYICPNCGDSGERAITEEDIHNLNRLGKVDLQRTRAFQRVMPDVDYERESIEAALDCYLPRAIFVTMLLINRLDGLVVEKPERKLLQAIMLTVFDDATSLWHWPEKDNRPLQLSLPGRFIEKNLWMSLDQAPAIWAYGSKPVPITYWPKLPQPEGGICLYQRQLADQKMIMENEKPTAIISVFPRPNQAFWTLSALWSGWLWGRKGIVPMRSALSRRHYDWHWFALAISASIKPLIHNLKPDTPIFGIFNQSAANFYLGLQAGFSLSGCEATGTAFRDSDDIIQNQWKSAYTDQKPGTVNFKDMIANFFRTRSEPASYNEILLHCLIEISINSNLPNDVDLLDQTLFSQIQQEITATLRDPSFAEPLGNYFGGNLWWLLDKSLIQAPLSERVESMIRNTLLKGKPINKRELEQQTCIQFPGSFTPSAALFRLCLETYADPFSSDIHQYKLEQDENQLNRERDLDEMRLILSESARKLGISQQINGNSIVWISKGDSISHRYHLHISADFADDLLNNFDDERVKKIILFPGSRSRLITFRLRQDPRLETASLQNWHFVKFRTLRRLAQQDHLSLENWDELLDSDPPLWDPQDQYSLF